MGFASPSFAAGARHLVFAKAFTKMRTKSCSLSREGIPKLFFQIQEDWRGVRPPDLQNNDEEWDIHFLDKFDLARRCVCF